MTNSQHKLEQAIEAAREYRKYDLLGDLARVDQLESTIDDLVGYWDEVEGQERLRWPSVVMRICSGEAR
jgi:hypothetical protein